MASRQEYGDKTLVKVEFVPKQPNRKQETGQFDMSNEITNINTDIQPMESIESRILTIRGRQVMLDRDLAELYGVETKALNQAVKRNAKRFPGDFMFQLSKEESTDVQANLMSQNAISRSQIVTLKANSDLKSQIVTSSWGGNRKLPYAFTEQGIAMLSGILRSETAIEVNIRIMRAFVAMRRFLLANAQVFQRIESLEMRQIFTDNKLNAIMDRLDDGTATKIEGIFYEGEVFSARVFFENLIKAAKHEIILIDAYVDASMKDLGKRLFAFTKMAMNKDIIISQL